MFSFFYITAGSNSEAQRIAKILLKKNLVACVNIYKNIDSFYVWKKEINKSKEVILMGKTIKKNQNSIIKQIKKNHSYDLPCIIFSNISSGNKDFLNWVKKTLK